MAQNAVHRFGSVPPAVDEDLRRTTAEPLWIGPVHAAVDLLTAPMWWALGRLPRRHSPEAPDAMRKGE